MNLILTVPLRKAKFTLLRLPTEEINPTQDRAELDEGKIKEYRQRLRAGEELPPLHAVVPEGGDGNPEIVDGHHRYWAHRDEGRPDVPTRIYNNRLQAFLEAHQGA